VNIYTSGQIPNQHGGTGAAFDNYAFTYVGALGDTKHIAFVDETENTKQPCVASVASSASPAAQRSGSHVSAGKIIKTFDTKVLSTLKTFAVCYSNDGGGAGNTFADSGIRVSVTKIWNMQYASGATGPACSQPTQGPKNANCKLDTKPRDMTSVPLATNMLPQAANMKLTYRGTLATAQYISLVDASLNSGNPCASGAVAGANADTVHSGPIQAGASSTEITIPQSSLLDASKMYAVCYDDSSVLPPFHYSTVLQP
jgi:hypothetical protein